MKTWVLFISFLLFFETIFAQKKVSGDDIRWSKNALLSTDKLKPKFEHDSINYDFVIAFEIEADYYYNDSFLAYNIFAYVYSIDTAKVLRDKLFEPLFPNTVLNWVFNYDTSKGNLDTPNNTASLDSVTDTGVLNATAMYDTAYQLSDTDQYNVYADNEFDKPIKISRRSFNDHLKQEQHKFDIFEIFARKMRAYFKSIKYDNINLDQNGLFFTYKIDSIKSQCYYFFEEYEMALSSYKEQQQWDKKIEKILDSLKAYRNPIDTIVYENDHH